MNVQEPMQQQYDNNTLQLPNSGHTEAQQFMSEIKLGQKNQMSLRERAMHAKTGQTVTETPIRSTQIKRVNNGALGIKESPVLTMEERLVKERREKAIADAENQYLNDYDNINQKYQNEQTSAVLKGEMQPMSMADV